MLEPLDVEAPAELVWEMLRDEARLGEEDGQAVVLAEHRGRELLLEVRMGIGFSVQHAYQIERVGAGCRITDRLRPLGWRWRLSNIFLFGRGMRPLEAASEQGLANLKEAAESKSGET